MYIQDIKDNTIKFSSEYTQEGFIYELLAAYGISKSSISRMKQSKEPFMLNNKVHFKSVKSDLNQAIEDLKVCPKTKKKKSRFLVVTDFMQIKAIDTKIDESLDIAIQDFWEDYDFFLPWAGHEKIKPYEEIEADQKAALKMAKLFDLIRVNNIESENSIDALNHFFTRLIFCYYAEDTNIFPNKNSFTDYIANYTENDGSDVSDEIEKIFKILNTQKRNNLDKNLKQFPYVNGGLFAEDYPVPEFTARARRMIIECGQLDWCTINPDIFGAMFQGVMDDEIRHELGAHYTSSINIMKVINPLFMDDLRIDLANILKLEIGKEKKLKALQKRITDIKIFDPACGSGNFLITAYKELRRLEMNVIEEIGKIKNSPELPCLSLMSVDHFYGIEINSFAVELAKLSLWLAEHQMNVEFSDKFSVAVASIPLKDSAHIVATNACRIDWEDVCPKNEYDEIYILGNPPYLGSSKRNIEQKNDMEIVFNGFNSCKKLDYIACWFKKASDYIFEFNAKYSFVSTDSLCQGEQVGLLWPYVFNKNEEIFFAHQRFSWSNNAIKNATVFCVIAGIQNSAKTQKFLYKQNSKKIVNEISPYLTEGKSIIIFQRKNPISKLPKMIGGNSAYDNGHLMISSDEKNEFINKDKRAEKFIKPFLGADDFLNNKIRYCLWIDDVDLLEAESIPLIKDRIDKCKNYRIGAGQKSKQHAKTPHCFRQRTYKNKNVLIIPITTSGRREYLTCGFVGPKIIVSNGSILIYDFKPFLFSVLVSKHHNLWMRVTSAKVGNGFRYSSIVTYNTFPLPELNDDQKQQLEEFSYKIIDARNMHPGKTMAELYDPDKMPQNLCNAHNELDFFVDSIYRKEPFKNDDERIEYLIKKYEKMIKQESKK